MKNDLIQAMKAAIAHMDRWMDRQPEKTVRLFHHNDSDGLSSGAILTRAFERRGVDVRRCCLEKTYPAVLKKIFEQKDQLIVFTDFAGRIAPLIAGLNRGNNLVLILDHHKASPVTDNRVYNLDP
jgi:single-stranded DNA-specific DHH superfamily exonuclease